MKALIEDSRICEVHDTDTIPFAVAPGLEWVDVPEGTDPDLDTWDGSRVVKPTPEPEPSIDDLRAEAVAMIKAAAFERIEAVMPGWMIGRAMSGGPAVAGDIQAEAERLRTVSDELEAQVAGMEAESLAGFDPAADEHWAG